MATRQNNISASPPGLGGLGPAAASAVRPAGAWDVVALRPVGAAGAWAWLSEASSGTVAATYAEQVASTTDGGRSWLDGTPAGLSKGTAHQSIDQLDAIGTADAWVSYGPPGSGSPQMLLATADGGRRWALMGRLPSPYCSVQMVTAAIGWCVASFGAMGSEPVIIYRTADSGRHWALESRSPSVPSWGPGTPGALPSGCDKDIGFSGPTTGWAAFICALSGHLPPIYGSTDAGRTWAERKVEPLPAAYWLAPDGNAAWTTAPVLDETVGAVGLSIEGTHDRALVYRSTDAGATWWPVAPPGPPRNWSVDVVTASTWKLTDGRAVLTTTDAGRTWSPATSGTDFGDQGGAQYVSAEDGWYAPVDETALYRTTDGGKVWENVPLPGFPERGDQRPQVCPASYLAN